MLKILLESDKAMKHTQFRRYTGTFQNICRLIIFDFKTHNKYIKNEQKSNNR